MNIATHSVEDPSPEAFASLPKQRSLFCGAPAYSRNRVPPVERDRQAVRRVCALLRDFTLASFLFLGKYGSVFTPSPSLGNPYTIQLTRCYLSLLPQGKKSGNGCAASRRGYPSLGLKPRAFRRFLVRASCRTDIEVASTGEEEEP